MRLPYIEYINPVRKIVVIDGQPFYFSASQNSNINLPMPFLMLRGPYEKPSFVHVPQLYIKSKLELIYQMMANYPDFLVKFSSEILQPSAIDIVELTDLKSSEFDPVKTVCSDGKREWEESQPLEEFIRKRIVTKRNLIISSRLSKGSSDNYFQYTPKLLKKLGLNEEEIIEALTPLYLEDKPSETFDIVWPDLKDDGSYQTKLATAISQINVLNKWLARQGGIIAHTVTRKPGFDMCQRIWQKTEAQTTTKSSSQSGRLLTEPLPVLQAKKVLSDYYTKGSCCNRFWSLNWGRNHIREVNTVLSKNFGSVEELLRSLKTELGQKRFNQNSSLMECIDFLEQKNGSMIF